MELYSFSTESAPGEEKLGVMQIQKSLVDENLITDSGETE